jgi:hypothetical protein
MDLYLSFFFVVGLTLLIRPAGRARPGATVNTAAAPFAAAAVKGSNVESLHLTSFSPCLTGPVDYPFASRHKGPGLKSLRGYLCETRILLLALSRYIGDPNVIDHCGLVWGGPRPEPSLGPPVNNVIIPLDLTQLSCPGITLAAVFPSGFTTDGVGWWGGGLWRACNFTSFSQCLTGPVDYPFASVTRDLVSNPLGVLMWNRDSPVSFVSLQ